MHVANAGGTLGRRVREPVKVVLDFCLRTSIPSILCVLVTNFISPRVTSSKLTTQEPERWNERQDIILFHETTATDTLEELEEHEFIPKRPTAFYLKPYVAICQHIGA